MSKFSKQLVNLSGKAADGSEHIKEKLLVDSAAFSASSLFAQVVGVLKGLVVMRMLRSSLYGILMTLNFLTSWTPFAQLGAVFGMQREIPRARAHNDQQEVLRIQDSAFGFYLLTTVLVVAAILGVAFLTWTGPRFEVALSVGLLFFAAVVLLQNLELFLDGRLRADHRFRLIARCNRLKALILAGVTFALVFVMNIYGVYVAMLVTGFFAVAFLYFKSGFHLRFRLHWKSVRNLLQVGFPIMVSWLFLTALQSVDRVMILTLLGIEKLGLYGLGLQMSLYLIAVPHSLTHTLMPRVYEEAEKPPGARDLRRYLIKPSFLVSLVGAASGGILFLGLPWLASYLLPSYQPGLFAARILVWYVPFASLSFCAVFIFMGLRKTGLLVLVQAGAVVIAVVLNLIFLQFGMDIVGIALATTLTFILYGICVSGFAFYLTEGHPAGILGFVAKLTLVPVYAFASALVANLLLAMSGTDFWPDMGKTALAILTFLALELPIAWYLDRRTGLLKDCWHILRTRLLKGA